MPARTHGRRALVALALSLGAGIALHAAPAAAQMAAALGRPLPSPDLPVGTVTVRIVAGSAASPVIGTEVTLTVNDTPRVARTDSAGRASFPGLPVGATVVARVLDEDKQPHASESFAIPDSGGMRVMITTKPWQGGAGGAPFAGAGGGQMPEPRKMSGEARADPSDPAGQLTVRVTYNDFKDTPEGIAVALVGYSADDTTSFQTATTDKAGRVAFRELDRSGGTSYVAMALLPRNGAADRTTSSPIVLDSQAGVRLALSGEKRDSTAAAIDDLARSEPQIATPAGKVRVILEGRADTSAKVSLVDAATRKVIGEAAPEAMPADRTRMRTGSRFKADPDLPPGTLELLVAGGAGQSENALSGIEVRLVPATGADGGDGARGKTGNDGLVKINAPPAGVPQKLVAVINGTDVTSDAFDLTKSGGRMLLEAQWDDTARLQAVIDGAAPGQALYAECTHKGAHYRSMPFLALDGAGTKVSVFVVPRVQFQFQLEAEVEDELLAVRGRFVVANNSLAPYRAGPDGLVLAMPRGFKGAVIAETDQNEVSVSPGEGFRIIRPLPPFGRQFHAGLSLPVDRGTVQWRLELPLGADESQLAIKQITGMSVHAPASVGSETRQTERGPYTLLGPIGIAPQQAMELTIDGLPSPPAWRRWVSGLVGLLVLAVIVGGVVIAISVRRPEQAAQEEAETRRQRLLDELVELERSGANPKRRDQLLGELEQLWG